MNSTFCYSKSKLFTTLSRNLYHFAHEIFKLRLRLSQRFCSGLVDASSVQ